MKKALRILAAALVTGAVAYWAVAGANRGWTKTRVPVKVVDEVTGLDGIVWPHRFVPGVDFLAVALLGAGILAGVSFFIPAKSKSSSNQIQK